ncbi:MAG: hypothetical protein ACRD0K_10065 [Egibacteraceae bacterium]
MKAVAITRVELGYCANCNAPAVVGHVAVRGWAHEPAICEACLVALVERVRRIADANRIRPPVELVKP